MLRWRARYFLDLFIFLAIFHGSIARTLKVDDFVKIFGEVHPEKAEEKEIRTAQEGPKNIKMLPASSNEIEETESLELVPTKNDEELKLAKFKSDERFAQGKIALISTDGAIWTEKLDTTVESTIPDSTTLSTTNEATTASTTSLPETTTHKEPKPKKKSSKKSKKSKNLKSDEIVMISSDPIQMLPIHSQDDSDTTKQVWVHMLPVDATDEVVTVATTVDPSLVSSENSTAIPESPSSQEKRDLQVHENDDDDPYASSEGDIKEDSHMKSDESKEREEDEDPNKIPEAESDESEESEERSTQKMHEDDQKASFTSLHVSEIASTTVFPENKTIEGETFRLETTGRPEESSEAGKPHESPADSTKKPVEDSEPTTKVFRTVDSKIDENNTTSTDHPLTGSTQNVALMSLEESGYGNQAELNESDQKLNSTILEPSHLEADHKVSPEKPKNTEFGVSSSQSLTFESGNPYDIEIQAQTLETTADHAETTPNPTTHKEPISSSETSKTVKSSGASEKTREDSKDSNGSAETTSKVTEATTLAKIESTTLANYTGGQSKADFTGETSEAHEVLVSSIESEISASTVAEKEETSKMPDLGSSTNLLNVTTMETLNSTILMSTESPEGADAEVNDEEFKSTSEKEVSSKRPEVTDKLETVSSEPFELNLNFTAATELPGVSAANSSQTMLEHEQETTSSIQSTPTISLETISSSSSTPQSNEIPNLSTETQALISTILTDVYGSPTIYGRPTEEHNATTVSEEIPEMEEEEVNEEASTSKSRQNEEITMVPDLSRETTLGMMGMSETSTENEVTDTEPTMASEESSSHPIQIENELEPSGYDSEHHTNSNVSSSHKMPVESSGYNKNEHLPPPEQAKIRVISSEDAVGYNGIPVSNKVEEQKDPVIEQVHIEESLPVKKISPPSIEPAIPTSTEIHLMKKSKTLSARRQWKPYVFDCAKEVDDRDTKMCQDWAKAGFCEHHKPTMFLFCRKTCLCVGPPEEPDNGEEDDKFARRRREVGGSWPEFEFEFEGSRSRSKRIR